MTARREPSEPGHSQLHSSSRSLRSYWLVCAVLIICVIAQSINYRILINATDQELSNWNLLLISIIDFTPWLLLAPLVVRAARRFPPVAFRPVLLFHLPVSVISALAILTISTTGRFFLEPTSQSFLDRLFRRLFFEFTSSFVFYWFLVGIIFMTTFHMEYRRKAEDELRLIAEKSALERELFSTRLDALHQQFKPHFLFNALHTVSALMETDIEKARAALIKISRLLRSALNFSDTEKHSLKAELDWLKDYVEVEQLRHSKKLTFKIDAEVDIQEVEIPPMLLQPLVENAVRHGAGINEEGGCIMIGVKETAGGLSISVDDNGPGVGEMENPDGFGVNLVRERLRLTYGDASLLTFGSSPSGGARAMLALPKGARGAK